MAGRLIAAGGMILALVIMVGTGLYIAGIAPPYPVNAWVFNGALGVAAVYGLAFGRAPRQ